MNVKTKKIPVIKDDRGYLFEIFKPIDIRSGFKGQIILTTAFPGMTKGKHFHKRKTEWYCVVRGRGQLTLIDNKTGKINKKILSSKRMKVVEITPNIFHKIKNIGTDEMYLLIYVSEEFDKKDPDTYYKYK